MELIDIIDMVVWTQYYEGCVVSKKYMFQGLDGIKQVTDMDEEEKRAQTAGLRDIQVYGQDNLCINFGRITGNMLGKRTQVQLMKQVFLNPTTTEIFV